MRCRDGAPLGGFVAKYMGDGALIYFGYPHAHEYDAKRAVRAGLEVVGAVAGLKSIHPWDTVWLDPDAHRRELLGLGGPGRLQHLLSVALAQSMMDSAIRFNCTTRRASGLWQRRDKFTPTCPGLGALPTNAAEGQ